MNRIMDIRWGGIAGVNTTAIPLMAVVANGYCIWLKCRSNDSTNRQGGVNCLR